LLSVDGKHALIVAQPKIRALDVERGIALLERVRQAAPSGARIELLGAHVFASAAAGSIRRDIRRTIIASLVLVALIFGLVFRRPGPVLAVVLPVAAGIVVSAGFIGWLKTPIHGITFGFGAVIAGIGVDYGAHLIVHLRSANRAVGTERWRRTLQPLAGSITLGALTTLAGLLALAVSPIPALKQLVLFAGVGVVVCFVLAMVVVPLVTKPSSAPPTETKTPGGATARPTSWRTWCLLSVAAIASAALYAGVARVRFDGNIRNLDHQPAAVRAVEARFAERYADPRHPALVVASGPDLDAALARTERIAQLLEHARSAGAIGSFSSLARVLPSVRTQRANLATYLERSAALRDELAATADGAGMNAEVFAPFLRDLAAAQRSAPLRPGDLAHTPLASLIRRLTRRAADGAQVLSVVHMSGSGHKSMPPALRESLAALPGVEVVSAAGLARDAVIEIKDQVARLSLLALAAILLLLLLYYRRPLLALFALAPVLLAYWWTWGLMGLLGVPFNIVSIGAFALVAGAGVDYGIFITDALRQDRGLQLARRSVLLAAATTLAGFGSLLLARSPVMWSLGFAVTCGVSVGLLGAVVLLPAVWLISTRGTTTLDH